MRILEYTQAKSFAGLITKELAEEVFTLAGLGLTVESPSDEDEMFELFREIRDSLKWIQEDISRLKSDVEAIRNATE